MIGKLIPAGTGMKRYKNIELDYGVNAEIMESYEREKELAAMEAAGAEGEGVYGAGSEGEGVEVVAVEAPVTPQIVELD